MSIDFTQTFGKNKPQTAQASAAEKPKAQYWLNIGYDSGVADDEGNNIFIALPLGIPLDTQEHLPANSRNNKFAAMQGAQNDLLDQLLAHAANLDHGDSTVVNLQIQLRRVNAPSAAIDPNDNPLVRKLQF